MLKLLDQPQILIILIFCLLFALTLHEFGHAYVAYLCGDLTAKLAGRMNINPLNHLDLFGSIMLVVVGFGYAKPVPVNPRNFRYRNGDFYVAAAGPGMNLLLAILAGILWRFLSQQGLLVPEGPLTTLLFMFIFINMNLCLFNLIPIGPLDGSYVLPHFLPNRWKLRYQQWNDHYGTQTILVLFIVAYLLPQFSPFQWIGKVSKVATFLLIY